MKLTFANPQKLGAIEVLKVDKTTKDPLAGAVFQLWTDVNETVAAPAVTSVIRKTTGADGTVMFSDLAFGTYFVQEVTPPTGYELPIRPSRPLRSTPP